MHACDRQTLTFFSSASVAILTVASSSLFAQALPRKSAAPSDKAVVKVQAPAKGGDNEIPTKAVVNPAAQRKMDDLLGEWEIKSKKVKSLGVKYTRTDLSQLFGSKTIFVGEAKLQSPSSVYLDFYEVVDGKKKGAFSERIVCDGKNVYQFLGPTKQVFVFPMDKDPEVKALNQGPLPFLFDMSVKKAKERYIMTLEEDSADAFIVKIIPKLQIDREEYSQALVKIDKKRFLPVAIRLWDPAGKDTKTFSFTQDDLQANVDISPKWFDGPMMVSALPRTKTAKDPNPWTVVVNPKPDVQPREAAVPKGEATAGVIGTKPAAKNAPRQK